MHTDKERGGERERERDGERERERERERGEAKNVKFLHKHSSAGNTQETHL